jgi:hypothetical protein
METTHIYRWRKHCRDDRESANCDPRLVRPLTSTNDEHTEHVRNVVQNAEPRSIQETSTKVRVQARIVHSVLPQDMITLILGSKNGNSRTQRGSLVTLESSPHSSGFSLPVRFLPLPLKVFWKHKTSRTLRKPVPDPRKH